MVRRFMSVNLESIKPAVDENVSNGTWLAAVTCARCYEPDKVRRWDGCHDPQSWTPEELKIMADRIEQTAAIVPILRELAENGGVKIS
jgi:hypothetical protein